MQPGDSQIPPAQRPSLKYPPFWCAHLTSSHHVSKALPVDPVQLLESRVLTAMRPSHTHLEKRKVWSRLWADASLFRYVASPSLGQSSPVEQGTWISWIGFPADTILLLDHNVHTPLVIGVSNLLISTWDHSIQSWGCVGFDSKYLGSTPGIKEIHREMRAFHHLQICTWFVLLKEVVHVFGCEVLCDNPNILSVILWSIVMWPLHGTLALLACGCGLSWGSQSPRYKVYSRPGDVALAKQQTSSRSKTMPVSKISSKKMQSWGFSIKINSSEVCTWP